MSKQLQKLVVSLEAESSRLTSQLDKSNKRLARWEKNAGKSIDTVKKAFVGLATVATGAIFTKLTKDAIEFADSIGKVSDAVGLTTETYQGYVHAASLAGIEQSQLNSNLTAFVKRVGEAKQGVGPLISFMTKYDETLLKNIQTSKNQEQAFNLVADAIKNAETATDAAAIANAAFSRAGVAMTLMMKNGSAGLREMKREAYDLGIVLDEQTIRKAEEANDKLDIMARVIKTSLIKQLVKLAPQIIKMGNAFAEAIPKVTAFFDRVFDRDSVPALEKDLESLERKAEKITSKLEDISKSTIKAKPGSFAEAVLGGSPEALFQQLGEVNNKIFALMDKIEEKKAEMATQAGALELGLGGGAGDSGARLQAELDAMTEQANQKLFILEESLVAENERLLLAHENRQFIIDDAFQSEIISAQKKDALLERLEDKHQKKMAKMRKAGLSKLEQFNAMSWKGQTKTLSGELANMTAGVAQTNKTLFRINKVAAIANAVINTYQGVTNALAAYPPPISFVMAGVQLAAGLAQVSAIKSTSFGGGGGAPSIAGTGGGAPSTVNTTSAITPDAIEAKKEPTKIVNIHVTGNPTGEQVRDLISQINDQQEDGAVLNATVAA